MWLPAPRRWGSRRLSLLLLLVLLQPKTLDGHSGEHPVQVAELSTLEENRTGIQSVQACSGPRQIPEPDKICLTVTFEGPVYGGETTVICQAFAENQHTPFVVNIHWIANATVSTCAGTAEPCDVYVGGLRGGTDYYAFCSGWTTWPTLHYMEVRPSCVTSEPLCGAWARSVPSEGPRSHVPFSSVDAASSILIVVYVLWSFVFEHVRILHETGMVVLAGLVLGMMVKIVYGETTQFSYSTFNFFLLPMVIFCAGFNLQKRNFFRHSTYILAFGVLGTLLVFFIIYYASALFTYAAEHDADERIYMGDRQRLIMAAVLASTDSVAPMAFLPAESFPRLFAVVFGEGVLNDVVSVLLSTAAAESTEVPSPVSLSLQILYYFATSAALGALFGFGASLLFRFVRPLQAGVMKPCALVVLLNYTCYVLAAMFEFSSIFALFLSALLSGHYAVHSLSKDAREFAELFAEFMAYCAEAFVFGYFGLTAVDNIVRETYSLVLIGSYFAAILVARFLTVLALELGLRSCKCGRDVAVTPQELVVIGVAGCMRGTIAYALILRSMPQNPNYTEELLISTILGIVLFNSIVTGPAFPLVLRLSGLRAGSASAPAIGAGASDGNGDGAVGRGIRNQLHACWHHVDTSYLKPVLRPQVAPEHEEGLMTEDGGVTHQTSLVSVEPTNAATSSSASGAASH